MNIPNIFHTVPGMYMVQSFLHALVATLITGGAIAAWKIESPRVRQRFRLSVILISIFSVPLYQLINKDRGSLFFRIDALFNSHRWLDMELWNVIPLHLFLVTIFAATMFIFIFQEMLPILRHFAMPTVDPDIAVIRPGHDSVVVKALKPLSDRLPDLFIVQEDEPVIFSTTFKKPAIYLSAGLAQILNADQVRAAVAHEIAHIARSRRPVMLAGFVLRMLMFFNPVVLVEFRRAIRNEEKICDDMAAAMTGKPEVLADTLRRFYAPDEDPREAPDRSGQSVKMRLREYSHALQLETRIARLEQWSGTAEDSGWFPYSVSLGVILFINYGIV